ncbi:MAG: NAD(+) synthase [Clostridia bacterium]|nr:NAD(+) synthase [Clostridia bacterium]
MFDAKKVTAEVIAWIRDWFEVNGKDCTAVVGISGGKDSSVVAALCVAALGRERVLGVLMPCGEQADIDMSELLVKTLGIRSVTVNIGSTVAALKDAISNEIGELSAMTLTNLPSRVRMTTLYAVSQSNNGRVANTCNLSEDWVGYSTRFGDSAGDFSPLSKLTVAEVKAIGYELGLPAVLVDKVPIDGLCGKTDEENLGFTYAALDEYIRTGKATPELKTVFDNKRRWNKFKLELMPVYDPQIPTVEDLNV